MFHDRNVHGIARRKSRISEHNLFGTFHHRLIDGQYLIDDTE